jgi:acyl carrier protein
MEPTSTDSEIESIIYKSIIKVKPSLASIPMTPSTRFANLGLKSIEAITVVFEMEEAFNVEIVARHLDTFLTIGEARDVVRKLLVERG